MSGADDPFAVLGLGPAATLAEVRAARRRLARHAHPDHGGDPGRMREINIAFDAAVKAILGRAPPAAPAAGGATPGAGGATSGAGGATSGAGGATSGAGGATSGAGAATSAAGGATSGAGGAAGSSPPRRARPVWPAAAGPRAPRSRRIRLVEQDAASFVVQAFRPEAFEALVLASHWLGEPIDDEPPQWLEAHLYEPGECWCRLDLLPEAGATMVGITIAHVEGTPWPPPSVDDVRDAWIDALSALGEDPEDG